MFRAGQRFPPRPTSNWRCFSLIDLLECAASLADYQFARSPLGASLDHRDFRIWTNRNPCELHPYDFIAEVLGDPELALRCTLPLINAAFQTSEPVRTFAELAANLRNMRHERDFSTFFAQPEPCRWTELFAQVVDRLRFDAPPDSGMEISESPYHRLTLSYWANAQWGSGSSTIEPLLTGRASRRWTELAADAPVLDRLLDQPGWVEPELQQGMQNAFAPPIRITRFDDPDHPRVMLLGNRHLNAIEPNATLQSTFKAMLVEQLMMYSAVRRASGSHFRSDARICSHTACPEYAANYCNAYPNIPERFEECGFPSRMNEKIKLWRRRKWLSLLLTQGRKQKT